VSPLELVAGQRVHSPRPARVRVSRDATPRAVPLIDGGFSLRPPALGLEFLHVRCRAGDVRGRPPRGPAGGGVRARARSVYSVTRPGVDRRGFASPAPAASPRSLLTHTHKLRFMRTLSTLTHEGGAPGHTHRMPRLSNSIFVTRTSLYATYTPLPCDAHKIDSAT